MKDDNKLSELEYFQALFGDELGARAVRLRKLSLSIGVAIFLMAAVLFLLVMPNVYGSLTVPSNISRYLPLYYDQYAQMGKEVLGSRVWWIQFVAICYLATLLIFVALWLIAVLLKYKRAQLGFSKIPIVNPPVLGLAIMFFPFLTLVFSGWWIWDAAIMGGYRIVLGPSLLFVTLWFMGYFAAIFFVWHLCILFGLIAMRFAPTQLK